MTKIPDLQHKFTPSYLGEAPRSQVRALVVTVLAQDSTAPVNICLIFSAPRARRAIGPQHSPTWRHQQLRPLLSEEPLEVTCLCCLCLCHPCPTALLLMEYLLITQVLTNLHLRRGLKQYENDLL